MGVCPTSLHVVWGIGEGVRPWGSPVGGVFREYGVPDPLIEAVQPLYDQCLSLVRIAASLFGCVSGEGCPLSPNFKMQPGH